MTTAVGPSREYVARPPAIVFQRANRLPAEDLRFRNVRSDDQRARAAARRASPGHASSSSSGSPLLATITGSTTTSGSSSSSIAAATASTIAAVASMPVFVALEIDVASDRLDLGGDEIRRQRLDCDDPEGVLGRDRRDRACAVDAERGERLQVRLDARTAAGSLPAMVNATAKRSRHGGRC